MASRRAAASLRDSRLSRASFERAELLELFCSTRDFCRFGFLLTANDVVPFRKSIEISVRAVMMRLGIDSGCPFSVKRVFLD
jgi:hypothetical protein